MGIIRVTFSFVFVFFFVWGDGKEVISNLFLFILRGAEAFDGGLIQFILVNIGGMGYC